MWIHSRNVNSLKKCEFALKMWISSKFCRLQFVTRTTRFVCSKLIQTNFGKVFWPFANSLTFNTTVEKNKCTFKFVQHDIFEKNSVFSSLITSTETARHSHMNRLCKWEDHYASIYLVSLRKRFSVCLTKQKTPNAIRFYSVERMCSRQMLFFL